MSIPIELLVYVLAQGPWKIALESGTYRGEGALILARYFHHVWAIQPVASLDDESNRQLDCAGLHHVQALTGPSEQVMADLLPKIEEPAMFWLGPHWFPDVTAGEARRFIIIDELRCISRWEHAAGSCILIQGAALLGNPPSRPGYRTARWPSEADLRTAVTRYLPKHQMALCDEALILLPGRNCRELSMSSHATS